MNDPVAAGPVTPSGVVLLTDRRSARAPLPDVVAAAVAAGVRWVLLRERDLPAADRRELADRLREVLRPAGGRLVVAGPDPLGGDAVHLPAAGPYPPPRRGLVGRSCHDASELSRLSDEDYVTLSPIFSTRTKPGYGPPLGPHGAARAVAAHGAARAVAAHGVPWLALGGVDSAERAAACAAAGASGVAVLGAVMRARDPGAVARDLVAAWPVPTRVVPV